MHFLRYASARVIVLAVVTGSALADEPLYPRFEGNSFEPSAAAYNDRAREVIVLNDKDSLVYRYQLIEDSGIVKSLKGRPPLVLNLSSGEGVMKFESLTSLGGGDFLAATSFDRIDSKTFEHDPIYARVIRFRLDDEKALREMRPVKAERVEVDRVALAKTIRALSKASSPWFKIEGLTLDQAAEHVFFGVRQVGADFKHPENVAFVVRCPFSKQRNEIGPPDATFRFSTDELCPAQGLSDIQRAQDGRYLILTSWEETDERGEPKSAPSSHAGALFRVEAKDLEGPGTGAVRPLGEPIARFHAKSEGLAILPENRLLVVFDDDRDWKKVFRNYEQSEGLFTVLRIK